MSALAAMILIAEAAASCAPVGASRLRAGAMLVQPVATTAPPPFEYLGPAPTVVVEPKVQRTGASSTPEAPHADQPPEQCEAAQITV